MVTSSQGKADDGDEYSAIVIKNSPRVMTVIE